MATRRRGSASYTTPSLDLFGGTPADRGGQLGLDLRAPDAPNLAAEDTARRQRIAGLERQRDAMRKAGWRTADLDDMLARLRARNPRGAMFRDANGVLHPIRSWFKGRGQYDAGIEQRRGKLLKKAQSAKLFHPDLRGRSPAYHLEVLRTEGERKLRESERLASAREETPQGTFEERYGIARPPLGEATRKAQRLERELSKLVRAGHDNDKTRRLEAQIRALRARPETEPITAYWAKVWKHQGSKVRPKAHLSERDILRLWAVYSSDVKDVQPTDDWYRDLHPDHYTEAIHGSLDPRYAVEAVRAVGQRRIAKLATEGRRDLAKAEKLEALLAPAQRYRRLFREWEDSLQAQDFGQAERLEKTLAPLERKLRRFGNLDRVQRASNPGASGGLGGWLAAAVAGVLAWGWWERRQESG